MRVSRRGACVSEWRVNVIARARSRTGSPLSGPRPPRLFCAGAPVAHACEMSISHRSARHMSGAKINNRFIFAL